MTKMVIIKYYHLNKAWYYFFDSTDTSRYSFINKENEIGILFAENVTHSLAKKLLLKLFPNQRIQKVRPFLSVGVCGESIVRDKMRRLGYRT